MTEIGAIVIMLSVILALVLLNAVATRRGAYRVRVEAVKNNHARWEPTDGGSVVFTWNGDQSTSCPGRGRWNARPADTIAVP